MTTIRNRIKNVDLDGVRDTIEKGVKEVVSTKGVRDATLSFLVVGGAILLAAAIVSLISKAL